MRESLAGRFHWNWMQILTEFLYLFQDDIKARILEYDVFPTNAPPTLETELREAQQHRSIYVNDYLERIQQGREAMAVRLESSENMYDQYWLGEYLLSKGRNGEALDYFGRALRSGFAHWPIYGRLVETALRLSGGETPMRLTLRGLHWYLNTEPRSVESAAPPLSRYQRLENWMLRRGHLAGLGRLLKTSRLRIRRFMPGWHA